MEDLDQLCRELYAEYEAIRDAKQLPRSSWGLPVEFIRTPDPHFLSMRLTEGVNSIETGIQRRANDLYQRVYSFSNYTFISAVHIPATEGKRFGYDDISPHENIRRGYEAGSGETAQQDAYFHSMGEITPEKVGRLFYYLGSALKRSDMNPAAIIGIQLNNIRELRTGKRSESYPNSK